MVLPPTVVDVTPWVVETVVWVIVELDWVVVAPSVVEGCPVVVARFRNKTLINIQANLTLDGSRA